jgi:hypothetical protein
MIILHIKPTPSNTDSFSLASRKLLSSGLSISTYKVSSGFALSISASPTILENLYYKQLLNDFIHKIGSSITEPAHSPDITILSSGDRIRLLHDYVTEGLDVNSTSVEGLDVFCLHDEGFNRDWIEKWGTKLKLGDEDIVMVRDQFGEKVLMSVDLLKRLPCILRFWIST